MLPLGPGGSLAAATLGAGVDMPAIALAVDELQFQCPRQTSAACSRCTDTTSGPFSPVSEESYELG